MRGFVPPVRTTSPKWDDRGTSGPLGGAQHGQVDSRAGTGGGRAAVGELAGPGDRHVAGPAVPARTRLPRPEEERRPDGRARYPPHRRGRHRRVRGTVGDPPRPPPLPPPDGPPRPAPRSLHH